MGTTTEALLARADKLIELGKEVLSTKYKVGSFGSFVDGPLSAKWSTRCDMFLAQTFGVRSPVNARFLKLTSYYKKPDKPSYNENLLGIIEGAREEIEAGYLVSLETKIRVDAYEDLLELAEEISGTKQRVAAIMVTGGVLEAHLRKLCEKHERKPSSPKLSVYITELYKAEVLSKSEKRQLEVYMDYRNAAAHLEEKDYGVFNAERMVSDVRRLMVEHPA